MSAGCTCQDDSDADGGVHLSAEVPGGVREGRGEPGQGERERQLARPLPRPQMWVLGGADMDTHGTGGQAASSCTNDAL